MIPCFKRIITYYMPIWICLCLIACTTGTGTVLADTAKARYLAADTSLKKLKRSAVEINKVSSLACLY